MIFEPFVVLTLPGLVLFVGAILLLGWGLSYNGYRNEVMLILKAGENRYFKVEKTGEKTFYQGGIPLKYLILGYTVKSVDRSEVPKDVVKFHETGFLECGVDF